MVSDQSISGVSWMLDPAVIKQIQRSVGVPVMAKTRVGHFVEAQILETVGVDYIDENETTDDENFINKHNFCVPFVCGCSDLGEGLRWVREGATMIRIQGDRSGTGDIESNRKTHLVMGCFGVLKCVRAIVQAVRNYVDARILAKVSSELNDAMTRVNLDGSNAGSY